MGHATAAMTLDVYGHLFPDELDSIAERLDQERTDALEARRLARVWPRRGPVVASIAESAGHSINVGAGGGARTLMPLRARRF
jgi:hypothetical protein